MAEKKSQDEPDAAVRAARFKEIVEFALELNSKYDKRFSQRDLADQLKIAPTMVTRYLQGRVEVYSVRVVTMELLARSCGLDVGALYAWIQHGREKALEYQERLEREPVMMKPEDLIKRALAMMENKNRPPGQKLTGYAIILQMIEELRESVGGPVFERLVRMAEAGEALERLGSQAPMRPGDCRALAMLLEIEQDEVCAHLDCSHEPVAA